MLENVTLMTVGAPTTGPIHAHENPRWHHTWPIRDVVVKYAEEHPNQTQNDFGRFAYNAFTRSVALQRMNRPATWLREL
jgi:hypothetical protein